MLKAIWDWLGRWEAPQGGINEKTQFVPAVNAVGYYPKYVPIQQKKDKADFSRAPQLQWWMGEDKKDACKHGRAHRQNRC